MAPILTFDPSRPRADKRLVDLVIKDFRTLSPLAQTRVAELITALRRAEDRSAARLERETDGGA